jgi:nicotinamide mononucleotide transporter
MSWLEALATAFTLASVLLTVHLKRSLYPVGIVSTILFLLVFSQAKLYARAGLQVYFTVIQLYGWWFWLRGDRGRPPLIGNWTWRTVAWFGLAACAATVLVSLALYRFTDAEAPLADTAILALSVLAQFLLDRKQLKSWTVWGAVNVLSIYVYARQGLWLTAGLYVILFGNVFYGWSVWRSAWTKQGEPAA